MKTLIQRPKYLKSTAGKIVTAFALTLAIGVLFMPPALAEHGNGHDRGGGRRDGGWHDHHGHGGWRGGGYGYGYAQPVYVPPPVYAYPPQSPGISLVLPLNFRR